MQILTHKQFEKNLKRRIKPNSALGRKFAERVKLFCNDPGDPVLKDHSLGGNKKGMRAFSIAGDVRVVYKVVDEVTVRFYDVGSHNQVY